MKTQQFDSTNTVFFDRQLEYLMSKVYEKQYPSLKGANGTLFPITSEAPAGAESITYRMFDRSGVAKIIANYADDLPVADVLAKEETATIKSLGSAFQYSIQEVANGRMAGANLPVLKATSARTSIEELQNKLVFFGDADFNIKGIFNNPNFTVAVNTGKTITDPTATAQDMYNLLAKTVNDQIDLTNGVEIPNTIVMPIKQYSIISSTIMGSNADHSVLEVFKRNFPMITKIEWAQELKGVSPRPSGAGGSTDVMLCFNRDPEKIRVEIPVQIEQLAPEYRNLAVIVNLHSRFAGVISPFPLSFTIVENI